MAPLRTIDFMLGVEGLSLLRAYAGDFDDSYASARIAEIRALLAAHDRGDLGPDVPTSEIDTRAGYATWSLTYDEEANPLIAVEEPLVHAILDGLPPGRAVDAACGTGRHSCYLAARGHRVVGVDTSPEMLAQSRSKVPTATFALAGLTALPLADDAADLIVCALALPHLPALAPVLREFARVLRPGGHLVLSDIHVQSLYLGGIASVRDAQGSKGRMPATRLLPSDYLAAALPLGFQVRGLLEPRWPARPTAGGPDVRSYAAAAADAAFESTPAAIIWHLQAAEAR
ncbi:class I SAM-dependent methyltransferase [Micromonosporaceae bacterium Da 78-11]